MNEEQAERIAKALEHIEEILADIFLKMAEDDIEKDEE